MQRLRHVAPLDLSAWTMDCVSEEELFLGLPVPTKHGHLQNAHSIVLMVCFNAFTANGTTLTIYSSERIDCYRLDSL
jgi:hypothetical protein